MIGDFSFIAIYSIAGIITSIAAFSPMSYALNLLIALLIGYFAYLKYQFHNIRINDGVIYW